MPDYREIYLIMARETEKAINILIEAQKRCEELYISAEDSMLELLPKPHLGEETAKISDSKGNDEKG